MIRFAQPGDEPTLARLVHAANLDLEDADYTEWTQPVLVAEEDGQIVGFLQGLLARPYTVLTDMAVRPDWQHRGIGQALLGEMETLLRSLGIKSWVTCIGEVRPDAQAALEKWGAIEMGGGKTYVRYLS